MSLDDIILAKADDFLGTYSTGRFGFYFIINMHKYTESGLFIEDFGELFTVEDLAKWRTKVEEEMNRLSKDRFSGRFFVPNYATRAKYRAGSVPKCLKGLVDLVSIAREEPYFPIRFPLRGADPVVAQVNRLASFLLFTGSIQAGSYSPKISLNKNEDLNWTTELMPSFSPWEVTIKRSLGKKRSVISVNPGQALGRLSYILGVPSGDKAHGAPIPEYVKKLQNHYPDASASEKRTIEELFLDITNIMLYSSASRHHGSMRIVFPGVRVVSDAESAKKEAFQIAMEWSEFLKPFFGAEPFCISPYSKVTSRQPLPEKPSIYTPVLLYSFKAVDTNNPRLDFSRVLTCA